MNEASFMVEDYLFQRDRMMLIDAIIETDGQSAITRSVTTGLWPLHENGLISPIVIVELAAQTAGVCIRWEEMQKDDGRKKEGGGLIVGVKEAVFFTPGIPVDETVITCSTKKRLHMNYAEYHGFSKIGDDRLGEVMLQVLRTD